MPDQVESYAGPVAWWEGISPTMKVRTLLDRNLAPDEMLTAASLDWTVSKRGLSYITERKIRFVLPDRVATVRDSDNAYLGVVSPGYQIVQNTVLAELGEALRGEGAHWHTAGSLLGGRLVWLQAELDREIMVPGDPSKFATYLVICAGHDGNHPVTFANTPVRVVCANTLHAALGGAKAKLTMRHTTNVTTRLHEVRKALGYAEQYATRFEQIATELQAKPMSLVELQAFTVALIPSDPTAERPWNTERRRAEIADLFSNSPRLDGVGFTAYRAWQAVAEWADHHPMRDTKLTNAADRRAVSVLEGPAFALKSAAVKLLMG